MSFDLCLQNSSAVSSEEQRRKVKKRNKKRTESEMSLCRNDSETSISSDASNGNENGPGLEANTVPKASKSNDGKQI